MQVGKGRRGKGGATKKEATSELPTGPQRDDVGDRGDPRAPELLPPTKAGCGRQWADLPLSSAALSLPTAMTEKLLAKPGGSGEFRCWADLVGQSRGGLGTAPRHRPLSTYIYAQAQAAKHGGGGGSRDQGRPKREQAVRIKEAEPALGRRRRRWRRTWGFVTPSPRARRGVSVSRQPY